MGEVEDMRRRYDPMWGIEHLDVFYTIDECLDILLGELNEYWRYKEDKFAPQVRLLRKSLTKAELKIVDYKDAEVGNFNIIKTGTGSEIRFYRSLGGDMDLFRGVYRNMRNQFVTYKVLAEPQASDDDWWERIYEASSVQAAYQYAKENGENTQEAIDRRIAELDKRKAERVTTTTGANIAAGEQAPQPTTSGDKAADGQATQMQKPDQNASLEKWFNYYDSCQTNHIRYTLKELAKDVHLSHGYIRQEHAKYKSEHG